MDKNKRRSLTIRLQPSDGTPLAVIADWLNHFSKVEKNQRAAEVFLMTLLPYAKEAAGSLPEEIERCYWESLDRLDRYGYVMRQALCISLSVRGALESGDKQRCFSIADRVAIDGEKRKISETNNLNSQRVTLSDIDEIFGI
jgi:hypothetical protein